MTKEVTVKILIPDDFELVSEKAIGNTSSPYNHYGDLFVMAMVQVRRCEPQKLIERWVVITDSNSVCEFCQTFEDAKKRLARYESSNPITKFRIVRLQEVHG
jgi:hypothetical protein